MYFPRKKRPFVFYLTKHRAFGANYLAYFEQSEKAAIAIEQMVQQVNYYGY
jgi:hypothetical protein